MSELVLGNPEIIDIKINKAEFKIYPTSLKFLKLMMAISKNLKEISEIDDFLKAESRLKVLIDDILGDGATEKIFSDREFNFSDAVKVILFVSKEFANSQKDKIKEVADNAMTSSEK